MDQLIDWTYTNFDANSDNELEPLEWNQLLTDRE
jgi:hypothetical protein